jgi:hypothetical protein
MVLSRPSGTRFASVTSFVESFERPFEARRPFVTP